MTFKIPPLRDLDGHCAILLNKISKTGKGAICAAVGDPTLPPSMNTVWVPDSLNIGENMCLVTLENPSTSGYNVQARSFVYELITRDEKKLALEWVINQSLKFSPKNTRYGSGTKKALFGSQFVQLAFTDFDTYVKDDEVPESREEIVLDTEL